MLSARKQTYEYFCKTRYVMKKNRHGSRILAVQGLYMFSQHPSCTREHLLQFPWLNDSEREGHSQTTFDYASLLIQGTLDELEEIDRTISSLLINWDISRLSAADLAILRISMYALKFQKDISFKIVIHEAILLCQELSGPKAYSFINGILDAYVKQGIIDHDTLEDKTRS